MYTKEISFAFLSTAILEEVDITEYRPIVRQTALQCIT
jgi:hypothetical protein